MKDERTLCYQCKQDYEDAGYKLTLVTANIKEPCDKCGQMGWTYEVIERNRHNGSSNL